MEPSWSVIRYILKQYDYRSLNRYLNQYPSLRSQPIDRLIRLGQGIIEVDLKTVQTLANDKERFLISPNPLQQCIYFYVHSLNIQLKKHEYADYLRGLTPLLVDVFQWILISFVLPDWNQFVEKHFIQVDGQSLYKGLRFNEKLIKEKGPFIEKVWSKHYPHGFDYHTYISSSHLLKLIDEGVDDTAIVAKAVKLRQIEKKARNLVAHEIVHVDEQWVQTRTGLTMEEIHHLLIDLLNLAGLNDNRVWSSLDTINQQLLSLINHQQQLNDIENNKEE